ncbi:alkaline shock response membrane anchor protein AmaP [Streptomyces bathyalis]|uniref:Alkaline shock response membrane anchor protein AmaP n=1 Tax=Streptomyces bathyalis TaxID=2710756 RepID=A0A7T1WUS4_9ACTN|nr:alkaline shock response membrane anchor protein AmaP [Streptomyces bathyalis]QPP09522.1 alkaline shock response membrane anchor protein AmaP [Streptomyces bathyalis]
MDGVLRSVNRVVLAVAGVLLLALGLAVLVGGFDLPRHWHFSLPSGWPWTEPDDVLLSDADRTRWRAESWWWPAVLGGLAVLVILLLWWLLAQLRRRRLGEVLVESGEGEGALLRGRALSNVLEAEAASLPGVDKATVRLSGRRTAPRASVELLLAAHAEPGPVLARVTGEALEHARTSASLDGLPAEVRLRTVKHRPERVV